jgi:hypothetical protein
MTATQQPTLGQLATEANQQGLSVYSWKLHVSGDVQECLADSWDACGLFTDESGNPVRDSKGNTVGRYSVREIKPRVDSSLLREWWG